MAPGVVRAAAVLMTAALAALAGCGAKAADDAALPTGGALSAPAGGATPATHAPYGPDLTFPPDVTLAFDYADTGDKAKDTVLHDWEAGQRVLAYAQTVPDPRYQALGRYYAGPALADSVGSLTRKTKVRQTVVGTRRYYQVHVVEVAGQFARVTWCVDDSRFFARSMATTQAVVAHGPGDYYRITGNLQRDPKIDTWVLTRATSEVGVQC